MSYWYLATVYRKHSGGLDAAADEAERIAAKFVDAGIPVFCPIAHSHHVSKHTQIASDDPLWVNLQLPFMAPSKGLIVMMMEGWENSDGIRKEREWFRSEHRPIVCVNPDDPVGDFRRVFPSW